MKSLIICLFGFSQIYLACQSSAPKAAITQAAAPAIGDTIKPIVKSDEEWKKEMTSDQFYVMRKQGTERAFSGTLYNIHDAGTYVCSACALPLFSSEAKFDSGTGWPSYYQSVKKEYVKEVVDNSYGMKRTEVECARCGSHLGHVFDDGPRPTGLRYCINSVCLTFIKQ
jgi:peptide-methionine (R)-S-oxide reductase